MFKARRHAEGLFQAGFDAEGQRCGLRGTHLPSSGWITAFVLQCTVKLSLDQDPAAPAIAGDSSSLNGTSRVASGRLARARKAASTSPSSGKGPRTFRRRTIQNESTSTLCRVHAKFVLDAWRRATSMISTAAMAPSWAHAFACLGENFAPVLIGHSAVYRSASTAGSVSNRGRSSA